VIQTFSGFLSDSAYPDLFAQYPNADMILLGLSTPRTQRVAVLAAQACPHAIVWGIGAGTIKIFAGTLQEAPAFWRRVGMQWIYRLAIEPRALWRRYVLGNPLFVARILGARWQARIKKI
jgi:exopolysaccharide biosynthesis WecB/TagA/CpsF family protein